MRTNIRKWGNAAGTIIPASVLAEAGFRLVDAVDIEVVDGKIVIRWLVAAPTFSLDELLKASPQEIMRLDEEDREWLQDAHVGG